MRILYIDIDSLRPDHLGCYGYHRATSPAIDRIAREGVIFEKCYTPDAPCLPSRTALYSGRFGIQTGVVGHGGTASQPKIQGPETRHFRDRFDEDGLARQLQDLGFHTAMISPFGQRHAAHWFYAGFHEIHNTGQGGMESAETVQPVVEKWLQDHAAGDHWYLHINYWDPHTPYRVPSSYGNPFENDLLPAWLDSDELIARHAQKTGPHSACDVAMYNDHEDPAFPRHPGKIADRHDMRRLIDGYDTGVRYVDDQIGRIVAFLKESGVYEDTAIIISADHGENLGELGIYGEHGTADDTTCRVPLIIKYPGGAGGVKNTRFHYNLDLVPTLMELLGGPQKAIWDGESFAAAVRQGADCGREEVIISQCCHVCQRSVRWAHWLYMRTYHDGYHLFPQEMLFDLENDPHEQTNLADQHPELCREGLWRLGRWHDAQMHKMSEYSTDTTDPLWTVIREGGPFHARLLRHYEGRRQTEGPQKFEAYLERLEKTGRADGAAALRERHGWFLLSPGDS
jgi:choline-sulfatase